MNNSEITSLISLLEDPDPVMFNSVSQRLINEGSRIIPYLEIAGENPEIFGIHDKISDIIQQIHLKSVKNNLSDWITSGANNLLDGAFWIAKYQFHKLNLPELKTNLKTIVQDVWLELNENLTSFEKIKIINHILFKVHGFKRNISDLFSPNNSYINQVLTSRKGDPLSLSIIYLLVTTELKLPVLGIDFPNNFILAWSSEFASEYRIESEGNSLLFYISPFYEGEILSKKELDFYLEQQNIEPKESYFLPCGNVEIIQRLILNLMFSYKKSGHTEKVKELEQLLEILKIT